MITNNEFRKWRRNNDITLQQVARVINVHHSTLSRWEHGLIRVSENNYNKLIQFYESRHNEKRV